MTRPEAGPASPVVTVVQHQATCGAGHLGSWLEAAGVRLWTVRPYDGDDLPDEVRGDGLLVLGGDMGAYDDERAPWLPATRRLLARAVADGVPTLGLCLGGQLLAAACGGAVAKGGAGLEVGVRPLTLTRHAQADVLLGGFASALESLQWHADEIAVLPPGAVRLATGVPYPNQAFRLGRSAWGVQFHPEATVPDVAAWAEADAALLAGHGIAPESVVAGFDAASPRLTAMWRPLAERFAALVRREWTSR